MALDFPLNKIFLTIISINCISDGLRKDPQVDRSMFIVHFKQEVHRYIQLYVNLVQVPLLRSN